MLKHLLRSQLLYSPALELPWESGLHGGGERNTEKTVDIQSPLKWRLVVSTKMVRTHRRDHTDNVLTLSQAPESSVYILFPGKLEEAFVVD